MMSRTTNVLLLLTVLAFSAVAQEPFPGLNLISPLNSDDTYLVDMNINVVKIWHGADVPAQSAYMFPDSSILRPCKDPNGQFPVGGYGGHIQKIDASDTVVWDYYFSTYDHVQHHDIEPMPNGNVLMIAWERKTQAEAIAAGRQTISGEMWPTLIAEVEPVGATGGNIVWEWHLWDHLIQDADPAADNYGVVADHPELLDVNFGNAPNGSWDHANCIDYHPALDQIVFSSREMSEIYVIDHSTTTEEAAGHTGGNSGRGGDILYRWGNPQVYDRGTADDQYVFTAHGSVWVEAGMPGAGNILIFNNGDRPGSINDYSSIEEITPPLDGNNNYVIDPGEPFEPATPIWTYQNPPSFYSQRQGGVFRLPNGNTLITESSSRYIFEVTKDGTTIWYYLATGNCYRVQRYWSDATGIQEQQVCALHVKGNYPNPFNPRTTIRFELPAPDRVKLEIFDMRGRLVAVLLDSEMNAGMHDIVWDGTDATGRPVSSGTYLAHVTTDIANGSQKMLLMK